MNIFSSISFIICNKFGCSKEPFTGDSSFEYPQDMFWLRNKKINFQLCIVKNGLAPRKINKIFERTIVKIFSSISLNISFRCSKEPSHQDGSP